MNNSLTQLYPYPFEKLLHRLCDVTPDNSLRPVMQSIGEPRSPSPVLSQ